jgi:hypothetical protein
VDKRYQVFVSSTYRDLRRERQQVMHALLELDLIPSGMELFPAADDSQWRLIERTIDECDYYILILAGRYGSVRKDGVGYTEKEYRYAAKIGKPILVFLHRDINKLPGERLESSDEGRAKLAAFRSLVSENRHCKHWRSAAGLGAVVSRAMSRLIKERPGIGWVRSDQMAEAGAREVLRLRQRVEELEQQIAELTVRPPSTAEGLSQGEDQAVFQAKVQLVETRPAAKDAFEQLQQMENPPPKRREAVGVSLTWNELFACVAPAMIDDESEGQIRRRIDDYIARAAVEESATLETKKWRVQAATTNSDEFARVLVQFRALGLITKSTRKHSPADRNTYWSLTPYGDSVMTSLIAVKRSAASSG